MTQLYCPGDRSPLNALRPHALCIACRNYLYAAEGMTPMMQKSAEGWDCINLDPPKAKPEKHDGA